MNPQPKYFEHLSLAETVAAVRETEKSIADLTTKQQMWLQAVSSMAKYEKELEEYVDSRPIVLQHMLAWVPRSIQWSKHNKFKMNRSDENVSVLGLDWPVKDVRYKNLYITQLDALMKPSVLQQSSPLFVIDDTFEFWVTYLQDRRSFRVLPRELVGITNDLANYTPEHEFISGVPERNYSQGPSITFINEYSDHFPELTSLVQDAREMLLNLPTIVDYETSEFVQKSYSLATLREAKLDRSRFYGRITYLEERLDALKQHYDDLQGDSELIEGQTLSRIVGLSDIDPMASGKSQESTARESVTNHDEQTNDPTRKQRR